MELNITDFARTARTEDFSDSIANSGNPNVGEATWNNALGHAAIWPNVSRDVLIPYFAEYGAWDDLDTWPDGELNALLVQMIAGDLVEYRSYETPAAYDEAVTNGQASGNIFTTGDGELFYSVSH